MDPNAGLSLFEGPKKINQETWLQRGKGGVNNNKCILLSESLSPVSPTLKFNTYAIASTALFDACSWFPTKADGACHCDALYLITTAELGSWNEGSRATTLVFDSRWRCVMSLALATFHSWIKSPFPFAVLLLCLSVELISKFVTCYHFTVKHIVYRVSEIKQNAMSSSKTSIYATNI